MLKLTEDFIPVTLPLTQFQKVLRNMRTIIEVLIKHTPVKKDDADLTQVVRGALGRAITQHYSSTEKRSR